jgi:hypothetical protein
MIRRDTDMHYPLSTTTGRVILGLTLAAWSPVLAHATPDLRITEVWPGGLEGEENTSDWIELANLGTTAITNLSDYHFDDSLPNALANNGAPLSGGALTGVSTLLPGESAVFLVKWEAELGNNPNPTLADAIAAFEAMWGVTAGLDLKLGHILDANGGDGPGLSQDGDSVVIFDGSTVGSNLIDQVSFPSSDRASYIYNPITDSFGELAQVGVFGAREGLLPGSDQTTEPPIGSPGVVPEPGTALLTLFGMAVLIRRRSSVR